MATYYVRADGTVTAANKANATSDAAASTSLNRSTHNDCSFEPGDIIVISDAGGEYFNGIYPPSSGTSGNKINYVASGSPIVNGYSLITGWTAEGTANVWKATWTNSSPIFISVNLTVGKKYASTDLASMDTNGDWAFDTVADEVYLYDDTSDPDTYSSPGVTGNLYASGIGILEGVGYLNIDGIRVRFCSEGGFRALEPGNYVTFSNCIAEYCEKGFETGVSTGATYSNLTIEDCTARYNAMVGINPAWNGQYVTVRRNTAHNNGNVYDSQWMSGIKVFDDTATFIGFDCYENVCYNNGYNSDSEVQGDGCGIWLDATQGTSGAPNRIHHNLIYDCVGVGIFLEICQYSYCYGNIVYRTAETSLAGQSSANIVVDTRLDFVSSNNLVYNNTVVGGQRGIKVDAYSKGACELNNNEVKNNICVGFSVCALFADNGGDNDAVNGSGNVYDHNCFGPEASGFIKWGSSTYDTYAAWKTAHGEAWTQVAGDPLFTNAGSDDYTLSTGSPCIGTALDDLGAPYNVGLLQASTWPDGVLTGDRDNY